MATGRGQFFRSLMEGLDRKPTRPTPDRRQPDRGGGKPGPGGGRAGPCGAPADGGSGKRRPLAAARSCSAGGTEHSCPKPKTEKNTDVRPSSSSSAENWLQRLPSEILLKILSHLDAASLFCIGHVSRLFHALANDDVMWQKLYMSEFGDRMWQPRPTGDAAVKVEAEQRAAGHWRKMYLRMVAGQKQSTWWRELRHINLHTGLPRRTEWILRNMNVSWQLTVCDRWGGQLTLEPSRAYFFETSVIVCWGNGNFPEFHNIRSIQLHGARREPPSKRSSWRSLILMVDVKAHAARLIGRDRVIKLMLLSPGFLIGIWRGQTRVAFIQTSLHFHRLVEKSLLGSPACPYSESADRPHADALDPKFGLHGYTMHFVLHSSSTEIMVGHFRELCASTVRVQGGLVELEAISRNNMSQHRSLSGNIKLPWRSEALEGSVENCCIMTLTLLDEFQKPFWCVSTPVCIKMVKKHLSFDYGENFVMEHRNRDGKVKMMLVWLKEEKQFFLISLVVYVSVLKVNKHFSTKY